VCRIIPHPWLLTCICVVGFILSPLLVGFGPFGGDPVLLYQPLKVELARALSSGRLPFWSDRFGLGIPLVAESHVAAFYVPNWLLYRLWEVETAYRLTMWLHLITLAATTFAYARVLGISNAGSALTGISFTLCGFQAVHTVHEPFYHVMPYLPFCLLLADRYVITGRLIYLAGLALSWGTQLTLGHFQIQMWTGGLVLVTGLCRALFELPDLARQLRRLIALAVGLTWGIAIAWVQLRLTWELTRISSFIRPSEFLVNYGFPAAQWAQFALPEVFLGQPSGSGDMYWLQRHTTPSEACAYVGIVPMVLAIIGSVAARRDRAFTIWRLIIPISLGLATMGDWWPDGYLAILQLPGFGWFRAPARYTLLTSLGLILLAGRGLDHAITIPRFWIGLIMAMFIGAAAWGWSIHCAGELAFRAGLGANTLPIRFAVAGLIWVFGLIATVGWRLNHIGAWMPIAVTALELGGLLYLGPIRWDRTIHVPDASPLLRHLASKSGIGLIGGRVANLPVSAGQAVAFPMLGIPAPPPSYLLEAAVLHAPGETTWSELCWQRRFGVTHGVWAADDDVHGSEIEAEIADPSIDQLIASVPAFRGRGPWKLVRNSDVFPPAWIAYHIREAPNWPVLYSKLTHKDISTDAWFLSEDNLSPLPDPIAQTAHVQSWDGQTAVVKHDGACILVLRRTYYPGWVYRVNGGFEQPMLKVDGGLQGVRLLGSGISRVFTSYRPTGLQQAMTIALSAFVVAVLVVAAPGLRVLVRRARSLQAIKAVRN
jgi:hypothetical protein